MTMRGQKRRLVIDASPILGLDPGGPMNGICRTTLETIQALAEVAVPFDILLFGQRLRGRRLRDFGFPFETRQIFLPRLQMLERLKEWLPIVETLCRHDLFHATSNFAHIRSPDRVLATIHDAMFLAYPEAFLGHDLEARRIPPFARRCRGVLTISQSSRNDIINLMGVSPEKVYVLPWGVRHDVFFPIPDRRALAASLKQRFGIERPFFLQVSCDIGRKNTPLLFDIFRGMVKQGVDADLVLVWKRPPPDIIKVWEDENLGERIHFLKSVSDADLRLLYNGALAMAFPSAYEGFGLPVLESMACGTPVITTGCSSLPEVGGEAALYVDLQDPTSLGAAMAGFVNGSHDVDFLRKKCLAQAAKFTWSGYAREIVSLYTRLLG